MRKKIIITFVNPANNAVTEFPVYGKTETQAVDAAIEHTTFIQGLNPLIQANFKYFEEVYAWEQVELSEKSFERLLNEGT